MKHRVHTAEDLGLLLRAVRKHSRVRQDDLAATVGVSKQFASDVENGKQTAQLGLVLRLLSEAGVTLNADIPDSAEQEFTKLKSVKAGRRSAAHGVNA